MAANILELTLDQESEAALREISAIAARLDGRYDHKSRALSELVQSVFDGLADGFECIPGNRDRLAAPGTNKLTCTLKLKKKLFALVAAARTRYGNLGVGIRDELRRHDIPS